MSYPIDILLEHDDFIVVNKPANIAMHDAENGIAFKLKKEHKIEASFPVHRLDTPTSGCLILAKNSSAARELSQQFSLRSVTKFYLALLDRTPKRKQGTITGDMVNRRGGNYMLKRTNENPAITYFQSFSIVPKLRCAVVRPVTGKTHQIRVAMKSLGAPIIGDERYSGTQSDRLYLHAWQIRFTYRTTDYRCIAQPNYGKYFDDRAFVSWLESFGDPDTLHWPKISGTDN